MEDLIRELTEEYTKQGTYWKNSCFENVVTLSTDYKGRWGEDYFRRILEKYTNIPVQWDEDSNTSNDDGVYDLFWVVDGKKYRVEVKTSGRTVSKGIAKGWQHENVYFLDNKWDKLVFVDYDANDMIYITIVDYDQVVKNGTIDLSLFGKNGHCRKNEEGKAKVDFSMKSIENGIAKGVTFKYNIKNQDNEVLSTFLNNKLV